MSDEPEAPASVEPFPASVETPPPSVETPPPSVETPPPSVEPVETTPPLLRVVKGDPSAEELAALVAVVASWGGTAASPPRRTPVWNVPARMQRQVLRSGPGAWRGSSLPR